MAKRLLREMMVVKPGIAQQRGLQVLGAVEAMGGQDLGDPTLEALDHAGGWRAAWRGQTLLDAQGLAALIAFMGHRWPSFHATRSGAP